MQQGASDDIIVHFDVDQLRKKINSALKRRRAQLKASRKGTLLNTFQDAMVAATFAQAGEFETAQEIYAESAEKSNRRKGTVG
jgi:DNA-binding NtrC family response regulator